MRITREALLKLARETTAQRVRQDRSIVAVYLVGSLLGEDPLLGGTTDIDLVFIHDDRPAIAREIVRMSDEIHLDIAHHAQAIYEQPRLLRIDSWLGPAIHDHPLLLHDRQHWFEFTQASAGSQFGRPDYVLRRARPLAAGARSAWLSLHQSVPGLLTRAETARLYLQSLEDAVNAVACLTGAPLTERRLMVAFPRRAEMVGQPGLATGLEGMLGGHAASAALLEGWLPSWREAFQAAGASVDAPARLHPARLAYYQSGIQSLISAEKPSAALWPLLTTWTLSSACLPSGNLQLAAWEEALRKLQLGAEDLPERLEALDTYLDRVEELLDSWAQQNGVYGEEPA